jgi:hypothetical protein
LAPMLSDMLSEGIRRVTVTVRWKQGKREPHFTLSQFVVHPTGGSLGLLNAAMTAADEAGDGDESSGTGNNSLKSGQSGLPNLNLPSQIGNPFGGMR